MPAPHKSVATMDVNTLMINSIIFACATRGPTQKSQESLAYSSFSSMTFYSPLPATNLSRLNPSTLKRCFKKYFLHSATFSTQHYPIPHIPSFASFCVILPTPLDLHLHSPSSATLTFQILPPLNLPLPKKPNSNSPINSEPPF